MTATLAGAALLSRRAATATSSTIRDLLELAARGDVISLAGGLPCPEAFPTDAVRRATSTALDAGSLQYGATRGEAGCRAALAGWSDVATDADGVVITTGSQQGLDLLARCLVDPGDAVVVSDPDYLGALQVLRGAEARLVAVATNHEGLCTDDLAALLAGGLRTKLVYVVVNFANPTTATMTPARRAHLVELAERYGFIVVEDDPYRELWFEGPPAEAIGVGSELVVRLRSTSKTIAPGLRLGWMTGPPWLLGAVERAKQTTDLHTSTLSQGVVTALAAQDGWLAPHLDRVRSLYRVRRDALLDALGTVFGPELDVVRPGGGMFLWIDLPGVDSAALLPRALDAGVAYVPGAAFAVDTPRPGSVRLSYATASPDELHLAAQRLGEVVTDAWDAQWAGPAARR